MVLFRSRKPANPRLAALESELEARRRDAEDLRELALHLEADLALVRAVAACLRPGDSPAALAEALHGLCFKPLNLACFYLALVDRRAGLLTFPFYFEGGRARRHPARRYNQPRGLTERALDSGHPLYIRSTEEGRQVGNVLTAAEQATGLTPATWYGVPLGAGEDLGALPFGLVSFQSFDEDAYPEARRRLMDTLAAILGLALGGARTGEGGQDLR
jgi:hypothetical protein